MTKIYLRKGFEEYLQEFHMEQYERGGGSKEAYDDWEVWSENLQYDDFMEFADRALALEFEAGRRIATQEAVHDPYGVGDKLQDKLK
jgi:hypothetical protein